MFDIDQNNNTGSEPGVNMKSNNNQNSYTTQDISKLLSQIDAAGTRNTDGEESSYQPIQTKMNITVQEESENQRRMPIEKGISRNARTFAVTGPYLNNSCNTQSVYAKNQVRDELYQNLARATLESDGSSDPATNIRGRICAATTRPDEVAEYAFDRNLDNLRMTCDRSEFMLDMDNQLNTKFDRPSKKKQKNMSALVAANFDTGTYLPEYATLLTDAEDTQVGSIMPKFVFREYWLKSDSLQNAMLSKQRMRVSILQWVIIFFCTFSTGISLNPVRTALTALTALTASIPTLIE